MMMTLLYDVLEVLDEKEKIYLKRFIDFYSVHGSVSKYLKSIYGTSEFVEFLKGHRHV